MSVKGTKCPFHIKVECDCQRASLPMSSRGAPVRAETNPINVEAVYSQVLVPQRLEFHRSLKKTLPFLCMCLVLLQYGVLDAHWGEMASFPHLVRFL